MKGDDGQRSFRVLRGPVAAVVVLAEVPEHPGHEGHGQTDRNEQKQAEFMGLHRGILSASHFPRWSFGHATERKTVHSHQRPNAVRIEYAVHKGFIRRRSPARGRARGRPRGPEKAGCALTRKRPRVSYLERRSFGMRPGRVPEIGLSFRSGSSDSGSRKKVVSKRKQTVAGSLAWMRVRG